MLGPILFCFVISSWPSAYGTTHFGVSASHTRSELSDPNGYVRGRYSYVDTSGKTISLKYIKDEIHVENENPREVYESSPYDSVPLQYRQQYQLLSTGQRVAPSQNHFAQSQYPSNYNEEFASRYFQLEQPKLFIPSAGVESAASAGQVSEYRKELAGESDASDVESKHQPTAAPPARAAPIWSPDSPYGPQDQATYNVDQTHYRQLFGQQHPPTQQHLLSPQQFPRQPEPSVA